MLCRHGVQLEIEMVSMAGDGEGVRLEAEMVFMAGG